MRKMLIVTTIAALLLCAQSVIAEQVTVFGPWLGPDQEMVKEVLSAFASDSGHDVRYVGSDSFGIALATEKSLAKRLWQHAGLPTSPFVVAKRDRKSVV